DRQEGGVCDTQGQETSWENSGFVAEPVSPKRFLCSPRGSAHAPHISACPKKLIEMSEDIETSTSGILSVPSPSESSAGVESERSFIRAWDDLKYLEIRVIRMLVENLDDLGSKLKEQADRYETADAETVEEINNIDFEEYRGELIERESYRIDLD